MMMMIALLLACVLLKASADTVCNGTLRGQVIHGSLNVQPTYNCELINTTVYGNVVVNGEGDSLVSSGKTWISGNVYSRKALTVELLGETHVNGSVVVMNMGNQLVIGVNATVGAVQADRSDLLLSGTARSVESYGDGMAVTITGHVRQGVVVRDFDGKVSLCGSTIDQALTLTNVEGDITIGGLDCARNKIAMGISLVGGVGKVEVSGTDSKNGKLVVNNHEGDVSVMDSVIRELVVDHLKGKVYVASVLKLSIGVIKDVEGDVSLSKVRILGRDFTVNVKRVTGKLSIKDSDMGLQHLDVGEAESVSVTDTRLSSATFSRNGDVEFVRNIVRSATFSFNKGVVVVRENQKLRSLTCMQNDKVEQFANAVDGVNTCI